MKNLKLLPLLLFPLVAQVNAETEDERRARLAIPVLEVKAPVAGHEWKTNFSTFDYVKPCTAMAYAAIVAHGVNRSDLLTNNGDGSFSHIYDINRGYARMAEFCVVIAAPKSGLSTTFDEFGEPVRWRNWWLTAGATGADGIPVRQEDKEIEATIKLMKLAKKELNKPVYLVIGNDSGNMSVRITQLLYDNGEIDAIDGIIVVNGGEYSIYHRDGSVWRSEDNTATK